MSDMPLTRAFTADHVRADREGRTVAGMIVPFDSVARVSDGGPAYDESFQRGAFAKTIAESGRRVPLLYQHNHRDPIGRATALEEREDGLYGEFVVSKVQRGDEALEMVHDGVIDSFSVGFTGIKAEQRKGVTVRTEVRLREASLVTFPAYEKARITAIRAALGDLPDDELRVLLRAWADGQIPDLTSASTPDGEPDATARNDEEPAASATSDVSMTFQRLRFLAREKGVL